MAAGRVVVMDRYIYSNIAYQGALGIDTRLIKEKNKTFPKPDMVFFLDAEPEKGLERISGSRAGGANVGFEKAGYLKKVYEIYNRPELDFMVRIDAVQGVEEVQRQIEQKVLSMLKA